MKNNEYWHLSQQRLKKLRGTINRLTDKLTNKKYVNKEHINKYSHK